MNTNTITVTLPLSLDDMKAVITTPDISVNINYAVSKLKGRSALIYLTNVNVPNATIITDGVPTTELFDLIDKYVTLKSTIAIEGLLASIIQILFTLRKVSMHQYDKAVITHRSLITDSQVEEYMSDTTRAKNIHQLMEVLDNITLFAITSSSAFKQLYGDPTKVFPTTNDIDYTGFTFINLLEYDIFVLNYYGTPVEAAPTYFVQQYDEYMYGGKNLFSYVSKTFLMPSLDLVIHGGQEALDQLNQAVQQAKTLSEAAK
jgi:hypothetical protein